MPEEWKEVYKGSGEHLQRVKDQYEELGYETDLKEMPPGEACECNICFKPDEKPYRLFVRRSKDSDII
jgi:hypothetical protein